MIMKINKQNLNRNEYGQKNIEKNLNELMKENDLKITKLICKKGFPVSIKKL